MEKWKLNCNYGNNVSNDLPLVEIHSAAFTLFTIQVKL